MRKSINLLLLLVFAFCISTPLYAQDDREKPVKVIIMRPPPHRLNQADLWNITIINSGQSVSAYLFGSMTNNENGELIATGQTMTFEVKKGTTNFKVSDLPKVPDVNYVSKDPKYKTSFMNTGGAPPGDYKICVELRYTNNSVAGEDCIMQKVIGGDAPQLISPRDEEELKMDNPVFTWMHMKAPGSDQTYTLRIVELKGDESPENAMLKNKAFFEKEGITQQMFQYPSSAPKFEEGKTYVWKISVIQNDAVISKSEIYSFSTPSQVSSTNPVPVTDGCMVRNPSFESYTGTVTSGENPIIQNVTGWKSLYKNPDLLSTNNFMSNVPTPLFDGKMFAGISSGFSSSLGFATEGLAADLINPVVQGTSYDFHARFLLANKRITTGVKMQAYVRSSSVNFIYNDLSTYGQFINEIIVNDKENWQLLFARFTAAANYNQLLIIGADETPRRNLGYAYIDSVDMCQSPQIQNTICNFSDDYESNAGWNEVKKGSIAGTAGDIVNCVQRSSTPSPGSRIRVEDGRCKFVYADEGGNDFRSYKNIGTFLENSYCWEAKFEFSYSALGVGGRVGHPIFALTSGVWNPINFSDENPTAQNTFCNFSDQDAIMVWFWYPTDKYYDVNGLPRPPIEGRQVAIFPWCKDGKELDLYTPRTNPIVINPNVPYYIKLERLSNIQGRITVYSDVNYSNQIQPPQCFDIPSGVTGLNTLQHSNAPDGMGRELTGYVDNTCIKKFPEGTLTCGTTLPPSNCNTDCKLITSNVSVCQNTTTNLKAYVGKEFGNLIPRFINSTPNFSPWPSSPNTSFSPFITPLNGKRYVIKATGGYPDQWGRVYDAAFQLKGTFGSAVCQGNSQFMLTGNSFNAGTRPNFPLNYNFNFHEYFYEFSSDGSTIGYSNINGTQGGSGNIQANNIFYELCDTNNYKVEWNPVSDNPSGAVINFNNTLFPTFTSSLPGTFKYEVKLFCKADNSFVDRDTVIIYVPINDCSTPSFRPPDCGCGLWNNVIVSINSGAPVLVDHEGILNLANGSSLSITPNYAFTPVNCSTSLYCWIYSGAPSSWSNIWSQEIVNNSSFSFNPPGIGTYIIRINPQLGTGPNAFSCPERNFVVIVN